MLSDDKVLSGNEYESWNSITPQEDGTFLATRISYEGHGNLNRTIRETSTLDRDGNRISGIRKIKEQSKEYFPTRWETTQKTEVYGKGTFGWAREQK